MEVRIYRTDGVAVGTAAFSPEGWRDLVATEGDEGTTEIGAVYDYAVWVDLDDAVEVSLNETVRCG